MILIDCQGEIEVFFEMDDLKKMFLFAAITRDNDDDDHVRSALRDEEITELTRHELEGCSCDEQFGTRSMVYI